MALLLSLAVAAGAASNGGSDDALAPVEVNVKPGAASGPSVQVPPPRPTPAVVNEVIGTLDLGRAEGDDAPGAQHVRGGSKRLARPFPEPPFLTLSPASIAADYDGWEFEVLAGNDVLWRTAGDGRLSERVEWDGSGTAGDVVARVGVPYRFRFLGRSEGAPLLIVSDPVTLKSMLLREFLGNIDLEVADDVLFEPRKAEFSLEAPAYLAEMSERMRRANIQAGGTYKLVYYDDAPDGRLARARARLLRSHFSHELLVPLDRVEVTVRRTGERGAATVCILPPEKGDVIRAQ